MVVFFQCGLSATRRASFGLNPLINLATMAQRLNRIRLPLLPLRFLAPAQKQLKPINSMILSGFRILLYSPQDSKTDLSPALEHWVVVLQNPEGRIIDT